MLDWLFEGWTSVYLFLGTAGLMCLALWVFTSRRGFAIAALVMAVLAGLYFLLDVLVETEAQKIERSLKQIASATQNKDVDLIFDNISESFTRKTWSKKAYHDLVARFLPLYEVKEVRFWDVRFLELSRSGGMAKVYFRIRAVGGPNPEYPFLRDCQATYRRDPDGRWRLQAFTLFMPNTSHEWSGPL